MKETASPNSGEQGCRWRLSHQYDPVAVSLADRHYSRASPGTPKFMPPGRQVVLVCLDGDAFWACSYPKPEMVNRVWPRSWLNCYFRRESGPPASAMILSALAVTRYVWGDPPEDGVLTQINEKKVRPTMVRGVAVYGFCYRKVGFEFAGRTKKRGLLLLRLRPERVPPPAKPAAGQLTFAGATWAS